MGFISRHSMVLTACLVLVCFYHVASLDVPVSIPGYLDIQFTQTNESTPTNITGQVFANIDGFAVYEFSPTDGNCLTVGNVFNPANLATPTACTAASDPTTCLSGELSQRLDYVAGTLGTFELIQDTNANLFGANRIRGRAVGVFNSTGDVVACATLGSFFECTELQYETANITSSTQRVCTSLTACSPASEYQTVANTATTDRQCADVAQSTTASVTLTGLTKSQFLAIESQVRADLSVALTAELGVQTQAKIIRRAVDESNPQILTLLVGAVNLNTSSSIAQATVISTLQSLLASTDCISAQDIACRCNASEVPGFVNMGGNTCQDFVGNGTDFHCFPTDAGTCLDAVTADTVNSTLFNNSFSLRQCDRQNEYQFADCLAKVFTAQASGITTAPPTTVTIDIISDNTPEGTGNVSLLEQGVNALGNGAKKYRNMIQKTVLPYENINYQIQAMSNSGFDQDRAIQDAKDFMLPMAVIAAISILLFVFTPIVYCCLCCCRCCKCCCCHDCCGGRSMHPEPSKLQCCALGFFTLVFAICVVIFAAFLPVAQRHISSGMDDTLTAAKTAMSNIRLYKNATFSQLELIPTTVVDVYQEQLLSMIDSLGADVAFGIQDIADEASSTVFVSALQLASDVDANIARLQAAKTLDGYIVGNLTTLNTQLSTIGTDHEQLRTDCDAEGDPNLDPVCQLYVTPFPGIDQPLDYTGLPVFDDFITALQDVQALDIPGLIDTAEQTIDTIPGQLQNLTDTAASTVTTEIDALQTQILGFITNTSDQVDTYLDQYLGDNITDMLESYREYPEPYEQYFRQASLGIGGIFALCGMFCFLACVLGSLSYSQLESPTERSSTSHCCAITLLGASGTMVIFSVILHLLLAILVLTGTMTGKICDSFDNDTIISQVVDNDDNWNGSPPLASLYGSGTTMTVHGILESCRNNDALYTAISLDSIFNVTEQLDIVNQLNISEFLSGVSLGNFEIIPDGLTDSLNDYQTVGLQDLNFTLFEDFGNTSVLNTTFLDILNDTYNAGQAGFESWETNFAGDATALKADNLALLAQIQDINTTVSTISSLIDQQLAAMLEIESAVNNLTTVVEQFTDDISAFSTFVQDTLDRVLDLDTLVDDATGILGDFTDAVMGYLENDIGSCGLLASSIDGMLDTTCDNFLFGFDAWWFSLALMTACSFALCIVAIKLSRYFRKMEEEYYEKEDPSADDQLAMFMEDLNEPAQPPAYKAHNWPQPMSETGFSDPNLPGSASPVRETLEPYPRSSKHDRQ
eukprot:m.264296 g.264296  ORF g.264296 m.264296 type:complete len:1268 (-) comp15611_c0_seq2:2620-6423(-)